MNDHDPFVIPADSLSCGGISAAIRFLSELSRTKQICHSLEHVLSVVARLVVPKFADACWIDLLGTDGSTQRFAKFSCDELIVSPPVALTDINRDSSHTLSIPLSSGATFFGVIQLVRLPRRNAFDYEESLDAKLLASGLTLRILNLRGASAARSLSTDGRDKPREFDQLENVLAVESNSIKQTPSFRVLVVADCRDSQMLLRALVKKLGSHEIRCAHDAVTALELLGDFAADVVLIDLGFPGMRGLELARQFRNYNGCQQALIVALSGCDDDDVRQQAESAGVDLFCVKPTSLAMLHDVFSHPKLMTLGESSGC